MSGKLRANIITKLVFYTGVDENALIKGAVIIVIVGGIESAWWFVFAVEIGPILCPLVAPVNKAIDVDPPGIIETVPKIELAGMVGPVGEVVAKAIGPRGDELGVVVGLANRELAFDVEIAQIGIGVR